MLQGERTDTDLVLAVTGGESSAFGELFDRWFNSSWNVARNILRDDDLAADVAQDALLNAWQRLDQLDNPDAFGGWLLRITRNRALTRLERERRSQATGDDVVSGLRDAGAPEPTGAEKPLGPDTISEVRDRQELLWAAAGALGEKEASLLDLHLRHGLGPAEIAEELGVEANNAHQQLYRLRTKLGDAIGSYLLWRNGRPLCDGLAAAVSGDVAFDKSVARAVARHQKNCDACAERRSGLVDPSKLFAGVPLVLVPTHLKANAAAALHSAGVPTSSAGSAGGSASTGSANSGTAGSGSTPSGGGVSSTGGTGSTGGSGAGTSSGGVSGTGSAGGSAGTGAGGAGGTGAGAAGTGSGGSLFGSTFESATTGASSSDAATAGPAPTPGAATPSGGATSSTVLAETSAATGSPLVTTLAETTSKSKILLLAGGGMVTALVVGILGYLLLNNPDESATAAVVQAGLEQLADDDQSLEDPAGPSGSAGGNGDGTTGDFTPSEESGSTGDQGSSGGPGSAADNGPDESDDASTGSSEEDPASGAPEDDDPDLDDTPGSPEPVTTAEPEPITTTTILREPETTTTIEREPATTTTARPEPETTTTTEREPETTTTTEREPETTTTTEREPETTTTVSTTTVTAPPVDPPKIIRFTSRRSPNSNLICQVRTQAPYEAIWATEGAEKAELTAGGTTLTVAASGSHEFCGSPGETLRLAIRNASGEDKDTTTLP